MDVYRNIASWIGWPGIVALLVFVGTVGGNILNSQIKLLKERNNWLEKQIQNMKESSSDILVERLKFRKDLLEEELRNLTSDQEASKKRISEKEKELNSISSRYNQLVDIINTAEDFLSDNNLVCPECGVPLATREYYSNSVECEGRDIDVEHERLTYECGLEILDGVLQRGCRSSII